MRSLIIKSLIIGLSVTGAIVGVGFASGREVVSFFAKYGKWSFLLCFLTGVCFVLISYILFIMFDEEEFRKNRHINKNRKNDNNSLNNSETVRFLYNKNCKIDFFRIVLFLCELIICSAMFAGIDSLFLSFGISGILLNIIKIIVLLFSIVYLVFFKKSVHVVNSALSLFMLLMCVFILIICLCNKNFDVYSKSYINTKMFINPFLFVGMNILTAYPLMGDLNNSLQNKKEKLFSSLFIGLLVFVCLSLVCMLTFYFGGSLFESDMIMVELANKIHVVVGTIYSLLVVLGLLTTLISVGFGLSDFLTNFINEKVSIIFSLICAYGLSFFGFVFIIDFLYPAIGFLCLIFIVVKYFKFLAKNAKMQ